MKKIKISGNIYEKLYDFDGGTYYVSSEASYSRSWVAIMDDGSLEYLANGKHFPTDEKYEVIER